MKVVNYLPKCARQVSLSLLARSARACLLLRSDCIIKTPFPQALLCQTPTLKRGFLHCCGSFLFSFRWVGRAAVFPSESGNDVYIRDFCSNFSFLPRPPRSLLFPERTCALLTRLLSLDFLDAFYRLNSHRDTLGETVCREWILSHLRSRRTPSPGAGVVYCTLTGWKGGACTKRCGEDALSYL